MGSDDPFEVWRPLTRRLTAQTEIMQLPEFDWKATK